MIGALASVFKIPELRKKILFTLMIVAIFRVGSYVPIPGTDKTYLEGIHQKATGQTEDGQDEGGEGGGGAADYFGFIASITGGSFEPFLFALGIMPYISASIILQLLTQAIPSLEKLAKEGEAGRKKIQEYTRYLTVLLCIIQAAVIYNTRGFASTEQGGEPLWRAGGINPGLYFLVCIVAMTAGTIFLMWLGELVDEFGIGNGISLIIMAGIVDRLPAAILTISQNFRWEIGGEGIGPATVLLVALMFVGVVVGVVAITQAQRRIPIQQAKHTRGRRVYGGQRQYLPLRINQAGVIPVIFASSLLLLPLALLGYVQRSVNWGWLSVLNESFARGAPLYLLTYVGLVYLFCYFWTSVQFRPAEMADNLRNGGSFIPGRRPGASTASYLERVMNRITFVGAGFLAAIAILPMILGNWIIPDVGFAVTGFLGGTGLLIVVSVSLDLVQRVESHLIMRHYQGFLAKGRVRGRR